MASRKPRMNNNEDTSSKYNLCIAFWNEFFDEFCERPNDKIRLFPSNQSITFIHGHFFKEWFDKQKEKRQDADTPEEIPSLVTLRRARKDERFKDVKNLKKHHHAKCVTCKELAILRKAAFTDTEKKREYMRQLRLHSNTVREWRKLEEVLKALATHSPQELSLFFYDDTSARGFPHYSNRPYKSMTHERMNVVPWLIHDFARNKKDYVYMLKDKFQKGANRIITELHAAQKS